MNRIDVHMNRIPSNILAQENYLTTIKTKIGLYVIQMLLNKFVKNLEMVFSTHIHFSCNYSNSQRTFLLPSYDLPQVFALYVRLDFSYFLIFSD